MGGEGGESYVIIQWEGRALRDIDRGKVHLLLQLYSQPVSQLHSLCAGHTHTHTHTCTHIQTHTHTHTASHPNIIFFPFLSFFSHPFGLNFFCTGETKYYKLSFFTMDQQKVKFAEKICLSVCLPYCL